MGESIWRQAIMTSISSTLIMNVRAWLNKNLYSIPLANYGPTIKLKVYHFSQFWINKYG